MLFDGTQGGAPLPSNTATPPTGHGACVNVMPRLNEIKPASGIGSRHPTLTSTFAVANRALINSVLFLSSFAPLFVLLAIRFDEAHLRIICAALAVVGAGGLWLIFRAAIKLKSIETVTPLLLDDKGADVSGYLATYLLPFLVLPNPSPADQVAYVLFLAVAGIIYVRSRMLQINPMLYLCSYRVFAITSSIEGFQGYLIARGVITENVPIETVRLRESVIVAL